jgi:hypothetical protein
MRCKSRPAYFDTPIPHGIPPTQPRAPKREHRPSLNELWQFIKQMTPLIRCFRRYTLTVWVAIGTVLVPVVYKRNVIGR